MKQWWRKALLWAAEACRFLGDALCDLADDDRPEAIKEGRHDSG